MHGDFCPACGFRRQSTDRFCRGCGDALTAEARASGPITEAETLVARGELDEALATIQRALGDVERADLLVAQATLYLRRGDVERAERSLERATVVDPVYAVAYAYQGGLLFNRGKVDESEALLDKAVDLDPKDLLVRVKRAEFWLRLGVLSRAEEELRIGLANGGGSPTARAAAETMYASIEKRKRTGVERKFVPLPMAGRLQKLFHRKPVNDAPAEMEA